MSAINNGRKTPCAEHAETIENVVMIQSMLLEVEAEITALTAQIKRKQQLKTILLNALNAGLNFDMDAFKDFVKDSAPDLYPSIQSVSFLKLENQTLELGAGKSGAIFLTMLRRQLSDAVESFTKMKLEVKICTI
jgi:hypothetical protein